MHALAGLNPRFEDHDGLLSIVVHQQNPGWLRSLNVVTAARGIFGIGIIVERS